MDKRAKIRALIQILKDLLENELEYRLNHTSEKSNGLFDIDYNLHESLRKWIRLDRTYT